MPSRCTGPGTAEAGPPGNCVGPSWEGQALGSQAAGQAGMERTRPGCSPPASMGKGRGRGTRARGAPPPAGAELSVMAAAHVPCAGRSSPPEQIHVGPLCPLLSSCPRAWPGTACSATAGSRGHRCSGVRSQQADAGVWGASWGSEGPRVNGTRPPAAGSGLLGPSPDGCRVSSTPCDPGQGSSEAVLPAKKPQSSGGPDSAHWLLEVLRGFVLGAGNGCQVQGVGVQGTWRFAGLTWGPEGRPGRAAQSVSRSVLPQKSRQDAAE